MGSALTAALLRCANQCARVSVVVLWPALASAQTSDATAPLAVGLTAVVRCGGGLVGQAETRAAAAILFRVVGDTVFAVTANHAVRLTEPDCAVAAIFMHTRDPFSMGSAQLRTEFDQHLDVAIVALQVPDSLSRRKWRMPRGLRGDTDRLFLFGCPIGGSCYDDALEVRVRSRAALDSTYIKVQSPLLEEGYSGGLAVDGSGQVVGMTIDYGGQNARVLSWRVVETWLRSQGFAPNLPSRPIDVLGLTRISASAALDQGARNPNGRRLLLPLVVQWESWAREGLGGIYALERVSLALAGGNCRSCSDVRAVVGTVGYVAGAGFGYSPRNWTLRLFRDALASPAFAVIVRAGASQQLIRRRLGDSTDYSTGLPVDGFFRTKWGPVGGTRIEGVLNMRAQGPLGIQAAVYWHRLVGLRSTFGPASVSGLGIRGGMTYRVH